MKYINILLASSILGLASCNNERQELETEISIPVTTENVEPGNIEKYISTTGTVNPSEQVELKSEISGKYTLRINPRTRKPYALGDKIRRGETIITIEDAEYRNGIRLESQKLNLEIKKQTLEKQKSLYEKGGVSQLDLQNAEIDYVNSKYEFENAQIQLQKMSVQAPFDGVIVDLAYTTGGIRIETGATLLTVMNYQKLYLEVNFPEKHMGNVKDNMPVRITHYTLPEDTIFGKISAISPAIDSETRTFKSTLILDNPQLTFRPGMFVKADLVINKKENTIVIPKSVVLSKQKGSTVFVVERGEAVERVIQIGLDNPEQVEVLSGLSPNEKLVVKGFETLANRSKVTEVK